MGNGYPWIDAKKTPLDERFAGLRVEAKIKQGEETRVVDGFYAPPFGFYCGLGKPVPVELITHWRGTR